MRKSNIVQVQELAEGGIKMEQVTQQDNDSEFIYNINYYGRDHICADCGSKFYTKNNTHKKFCCMECKRWNESKKRKEKFILIPKKIREFIPQEKECSHCNTLFIQKVKQQIYCSSKCSREHHKIRYYPDIMLNSFLKLRFEIFKRDNFRCQYCGRNPREDKTKLHIEHIIPKSRGGTNQINNLTTSCAECNYGKRDVLLEEKYMKQEKIENE